jgi:hypothetical protein
MNAGADTQGVTKKNKEGQGVKQLGGGVLKMMSEVWGEME